jgi:hypothetical protein
MLCNIIHSSKKKKKKEIKKENEREHITVQNAFLFGPGFPIESDCIQTCSLDELSLTFIWCSNSVLLGGLLSFFIIKIILL